MNPITKYLVSFLKKSDGAITVEGVLWVPIYAVFMALIVDTSLMFNGKSQAQRTLQDLNRLASSGYYQSEAEIEARALTLLQHISTNVTVDATIDTTTGTVSAIATMPASDLVALGVMSTFTDIQITVGARHLIES